MRLGQLSRKIKVGYSDILDYMENDLGVHLNASLNSKVDDRYVKQIVEHFSPKIEEKEVKKEENIVAEKKVVVEEVIEEGETVLKEVESIISDEDVITIEEEKPEPKEKIETIKAKAEQLEGLKVIGKIDLPAPLPPEQVEIDGVMYDKDFIKQQKREEKEKRRLDAIKRKEVRKRVEDLKKLEGNTSTIETKPSTNKVVNNKQDISFEEIRKKEESALKRRKVREEKYRKEKQSKYYAETHLVSKDNSQKKKKDYKKSMEEETPIDVSNTPAPPKSVIGKMWRWLTTY